MSLADLQSRHRRIRDELTRFLTAYPADERALARPARTRTLHPANPLTCSKDTEAHEMHSLNLLPRTFPIAAGDTANVIRKTLCKLFP